MVVLLCLRWWYGAGWQWAIQRSIVQRLKWCNETFSIDALARTLFAPFKQTLSRSDGPIDVRVRAFVDNIVSRCVGFVCRSALILIGLGACLLALVTGLVFIVLWPLAPIAIPISLIMMVAGVGR